MRSLNNRSIRDTVYRALDVRSRFCSYLGRKRNRRFLRSPDILLERSLSLSMKLFLVSLYPRNQPVFLAGKFHTENVYVRVCGRWFKIQITDIWAHNPLFREGFIWTDLILRFSEAVFTLALEITYMMYRMYMWWYVCICENKNLGL